MPFSRNLDALDAKILHALQTNARVTVSEISKTTGIPHTTIRLRMKALEKQGILKGYAPIFDLKKIGYPLKAIVMIKTSPEWEHEGLKKSLQDIKNVLWIYSVAGSTDGILMVIAKDMNDLNSTILKIREIKGIIDQESFIVMEEVKEGVRVPLV